MDWLLEQPRLDESPEVVLLPGDTEWDGSEGTDSHLRELPWNRFRLAEHISLVGGFKP